MPYHDRIMVGLFHVLDRNSDSILSIILANVIFLHPFIPL